jgi:hypothetical protein
MKEFFELKLGSMTIDEYEQSFLELLKYVPFIKDEAVKIQRYLSGLPPSISDKIQYDDPKTMEETIRRVKCLYEQQREKPTFQKAWDNQKRFKKEQRQKGSKPSFFRNSPWRQSSFKEHGKVEGSEQMTQPAPHRASRSTRTFYFLMGPKSLSSSNSHRESRVTHSNSFSGSPFFRISGSRNSGVRGSREHNSYAKPNPDPRWSTVNVPFFSGNFLSGDRRFCCYVSHAALNPEPRNADCTPPVFHLLPGPTMPRHLRDFADRESIM